MAAEIENSLLGNSFPVYYSKWSNLGPGMTHKGTITVSQSKIEQTAKEGTLLNCSPNTVKITVPHMSNFQLETTDGTFVISPGSSWLARGRYAWLSKEVRSTTRALLDTLRDTGLELPKQLEKLIK